MRDWVDDFKKKLLEDNRPLPKGDFDYLMDMIHRRKRIRKMSYLSASFFFIAASIIAVVIIFPRTVEINKSNKNHETSNRLSSVIITDDYTVQIESIADSDNRIGQSSSSLSHAADLKEEKSIDSFSKPDIVDTTLNKSVIINYEYDRREGMDDEDQITNTETQFYDYYLKNNNHWSVSLSSFGLMSSFFSKSTNSSSLYGASTPDASDGITYDHHLPLKLGISLSYNFSKKIRLTSGIDYAYCFSKFSDMTFGGDSKYQHAHYLGFPVHFDWEPYYDGICSFYIGTGAEAWKCLYANQGNQHIKDNHVYLSAICLMGIDIMPTRYFGFFIEPQYHHTFLPQNGNGNIHIEDRLHTSITERSNLFTINLGLRFRFD